MIKLPYGWDSAVQAAKEANGNGSLNNMQIAASIILELDSQLRSPEQTKTVADAVEPHFKATRENLMKIAKDAQGVFEEVEQEGEKWTHRTNAGELCKIHVKEPDVNGVIIVINERGEYLRHNSDSLKPIKQKLTKAEAWDLCQDYEGSQPMVKYMLELHEQYEII